MCNTTWLIGDENGCPPTQKVNVKKIDYIWRAFFSWLTAQTSVAIQVALLSRTPANLVANTTSSHINNLDNYQAHSWLPDQARRLPPSANFCQRFTMANLDYHLWHQDCGVPFHPSFEGRFGAEIHTQQDWRALYKLVLVQLPQIYNLKHPCAKNWTVGARSLGGLVLNSHLLKYMATKLLQELSSCCLWTCCSWDLGSFGSVGSQISTRISPDRKFWKMLKILVVFWSCPIPAGILPKS